MVVLLHREAGYEEDSPRAGEADLIVAKHRTVRPTDHGGVPGHYSRFAKVTGSFLALGRCG